MRHEGFDWTKDIWNESVPATEDEDVWSGNIAIPHLIFDDMNAFNKNLGSYFKIEHDKILHELSYLNSGGVCSKQFYIPLNYFFLHYPYFSNYLLLFRIFHNDWLIVFMNPVKSKT